MSLLKQYVAMHVLVPLIAQFLACLVLLVKRDGLGDHLVSLPPAVECLTTYGPPVAIMVDTHAITQRLTPL